MIIGFVFIFMIDFKALFATCECNQDEPMNKKLL